MRTIISSRCSVALFNSLASAILLMTLLPASTTGWTSTLCIDQKASAYMPRTVMRISERSHQCDGVNRRSLLSDMSASAIFLSSFFPQSAHAASSPSSSKKKCTDIESCRELGDKRVEQELKDNPVVRLDSGVRYKVLQPGVGNSVVQEGSSIDLIYSLSRAGGQYMYSQGFGYEMIDLGDGKLQKDIGGLDSLRVVVGQHKAVPIGIEQALVGAKKGERRRVELPPNVGFETSNWEPAPKTRAGKQSIKSYQRILEGFGSQPPFPAPTIWEVEVLRIRS